MSKLKVPSFDDPVTGPGYDFAGFSEDMPTPVVITPSDPLVVTPVEPVVEAVVPAEPVTVPSSVTKVRVKLLTKQRNGTLVFYNIANYSDVRNVDKEGKKVDLKYSSRIQELDKVIWEAFPFATADNVIEHLKLMGVE